VVDSKVRPKKRPRAKLWLVEQDSEKSSEQDEQTDEGVRNNGDTAIPATPIVLMQRVGTGPGIDPAKLTKEQLEADPNKSDDKKGSDD
jgi:hypothetical protein